MTNPNEIDPKLQAWLDEIKPVPPRNPHAAARGKAQFLALADTLREKRDSRHVWRNLSIRWPVGFAAKALVSVTIAAVLLSGGYATVYAAQDDLPNQPLYPVKLATENVRLGVSTDPQTRFDLLMEMTQRRVDEMTALEQMGEQIPPEVIERLSRQNRQALQIAANMEDSQMNAALLRFRAQLEIQTEEVDQLLSQTPSDIDPAIEQTRIILQDRLDLVKTGLTDPEDFRETVQDEQETGPAPAPIPELPDETATPQVEADPAATPQEEAAPASTPTEQNGQQGNQGNNGGGNVTETPGLTGTPGLEDVYPAKTHKPKPNEIATAAPIDSPTVAPTEPQPTETSPVSTPEPISTDNDPTDAQDSDHNSNGSNGNQGQGTPGPAGNQPHTPGHHGPRTPHTPHPGGGTNHGGHGGHNKP